MCGRTACTLAPDELVRACTFKDRKGKNIKPQWKDAPGGQQYSTSYNMAPTLHCPVLLSGHKLSDKLSERVLMPMKWGLTPSWYKDDPYKVPFETNNCRVEGMLEKKTYKVPLHKGHRCVVLMDGFFEWKTSKEGKQPYFFHFPQAEGFSFSNQHNSSVKFEVKVEYSDTDSSKCSYKRFKKENDAVKTDDAKQDVISTDSVIDNELKNENGVDTSPNEINTDCSEIKLGKRKYGDLTIDQPTNQLPTVDPPTNSEEDEWTGQRILTVAGVYDIWQSSPGSPPLYSYSVITVPASDEFSWCHHRMPAILTSDQEVDEWLDIASVPLKQASTLIRPTKGLSYYPVTKAMGNSRYKEPDSVAPIIVSKPKPSASSNLMMNWLKKGETANKK